MLGPVAIVADYIGVHAGWSPQAGFAVDLAAPNLGIETGTGRIPLVLPTLDSAGHLVVPDDSWHSVEALIGVLAANAPLGWFADLVDLTGWTFGGTAHGPRLSLQQLVATPGPALAAWLGALATDADLLGSFTATIAHLVGGALDGRSGAFSGSGTPTDPWLAALSTDGTGPALSVWLAPHGPVLAASLAGQALTSWRPGAPGLPADGLAQALFDEALVGEDVAALAAGRAGLGVGLTALAGRWVGTDGLVAPPADAIDGLTVIRRPDLDHTQLAALDLGQLVAGGVPAGAVVVRVAIAAANAPTTTPWTAAAGRLLDLTTPAVSPASFTVETPATGEWVVALAARAEATLGGVDDPTGLVGQSQRLQNVLARLATAGPVVAGRARRRRARRAHRRRRGRRGHAPGHPRYAVEPGDLRLRPDRRPGRRRPAARGGPAAGGPGRAGRRRPGPGSEPGRRVLRRGPRSRRHHRARGAAADARRPRRPDRGCGVRCPRRRRGGPRPDRRLRRGAGRPGRRLGSPKPAPHPSRRTPHCGCRSTC